MEDEENMFVIRGPVEEYGEIPAKGYFEYKPTSSQMGSTTINEEIKENIVSSTSQNVPSVSNQESASFKEGEKPSSNLKFNQEMDVHKTNKNGGLSKDGFYKDMTFSQTHNHQPLNVEKMEKEKEEEEKEKEKENDVSQKKMPTFIEKSQKKLVVLK